MYARRAAFAFDPGGRGPKAVTLFVNSSAEVPLKSAAPARAANASARNTWMRSIYLKFTGRCRSGRSRIARRLFNLPAQTYVPEREITPFIQPVENGEDHRRRREYDRGEEGERPRKELQSIQQPPRKKPEVPADGFDGIHGQASFFQQVSQAMP